MRRKDAKEVFRLDEKGVQSIKADIARLKKELSKLQSEKIEEYMHKDTREWNASNFSAEYVISIQYEISRLKTLLANAVIINGSSSEDSNVVDIGDVLELLLDYGDNDIERMILRLGTVHQRKIEERVEIISIESDLGKAIYKQEVGAVVSFGKNKEFKAEIIRKVNENAKEIIDNKSNELVKKRSN